MATGGLVEPLDTPGVYRYTPPNGPPFLVHGQPGEDLYKRYQAQNPPQPSEATGPDALAQNDRMGTTTVSAPSAQPETASDVPKQGNPWAKAALNMIPVVGQAAGAALDWNARQPEPKDRDVVKPPEETTQASAQAAPTTSAAPQAQPAQATGPSPLGYTMKGVDPVTNKEVSGQAVKMPDGSIGIYRPPTGGTKGGFTGFGQEEMKGNVAAESEYAKQAALEQQARDQGTAAAVDQATKEAAFYEEQKRQVADQVKAQQDDQAKIQAHVDKLQEAYDKKRDDFMNSKVDPDAYMKGGHGAVGIFSAIGVAFGQFGSAFTGQPNVAMQFVQSQIDRNIRAQEANINVKSKAADNMLADLTRETGSLSAAKIAMRQMLTERAAVQLNSIAASSKSPELQANANQVSAQLAKQAAVLDNDRKKQNLNQAIANPQLYRQGTPGRSGGFIQPTQESSQSRDANRRANIATGLAEEKQQGAAAKTSPRAASKQAQNETAMAALAELDTAHEKAGRPGIHGNITEEGHAITAKAKAAAAAIANAEGGDRDKIYGELTSMSGDKIKEAIAAHYAVIAKNRQAIRDNPSGAANEPGVAAEGEQ